MVIEELIDGACFLANRLQSICDSATESTKRGFEELLPSSSDSTSSVGAVEAVGEELPVASLLALKTRS